MEVIEVIEVIKTIETKFLFIKGGRGSSPSQILLK